MKKSKRKSKKSKFPEKIFTKKEKNLKIFDISGLDSFKRFERIERNLPALKKSPSGSPNKARNENISIVYQNLKFIFRGVIIK